MATIEPKNDNGETENGLHECECDDAFFVDNHGNCINCGLPIEIEEPATAMTTEPPPDEVVGLHVVSDVPDDEDQLWHEQHPDTCPICHSKAISEHELVCQQCMRKSTLTDKHLRRMARAGLSVCSKCEIIFHPEEKYYDKCPTCASLCTCGRKKRSPKDERCFYCYTIGNKAPRHVRNDKEAEKAWLHKYYGWQECADCGDFHPVNEVCLSCGSKAIKKPKVGAKAEPKVEQTHDSHLCNCGRPKNLEYELCYRCFVLRNCPEEVRGNEEAENKWLTEQGFKFCAACSGPMAPEHHFELCPPCHKDGVRIRGDKVVFPNSDPSKCSCGREKDAEKQQCYRCFVLRNCPEEFRGNEKDEDQWLSKQGFTFCAACSGPMAPGHPHDICPPCHKDGYVMKGGKAVKLGLKPVQKEETPAQRKKRERHLRVRKVNKAAAQQPGFKKPSALKSTNPKGKGADKGKKGKDKKKTRK